ANKQVEASFQREGIMQTEHATIDDTSRAAAGSLGTSPAGPRHATPHSAPPLAPAGPDTARAVCRAPAARAADRVAQTLEEQYGPRQIRRGTREARHRACREVAADPPGGRKRKMTTATNTIDLESPDDVALADRMKAGRDRIVAELRKAIVGQDEVVNEVLLTLFTGGNNLIVGVPGLAKTLLVYTLARVLDLKFSRIQFTPDLMPSDITGTDLIQEDPGTGRRQMVFAPGPIFANIVLADEINRTPPKTQSALLEAMQEHRVTIQGRTYQLEEPFYVFATQNPIDLEATYPLPEAQLDRFMFHIVIDHPPIEEEFEVVRSTTSLQDIAFQRPVSGADLASFKRLVS